MMKTNTILLILILLSFTIGAQNPMNIATQAGGLQWNRLPSDAEIEQAVQELIRNSGGDISVNGETVDRRRFEVSRVVKFHTKNLAGKREPGTISGAHIFSSTQGAYGTAINSYSLVQNSQTGKFHFIGTRMGYKPSSLQQAYDDDVNGTKTGYNIAPGFAPPLDSASEESSSEAPGTGSSSEDEVPWEAIIGLIGAGGAAALGRKLFKKPKTTTKKTTSKKNEKEEKEEEEKVKYILNLNKENFQLAQNQPDVLEVVVYKITPKTQRKYPAAQIRIVSPEKALKVTPSQASGSVSAQLLLSGKPEKASFDLMVQASADGHEFQKSVRIQTQTKPRISVETIPAGKRSLRPDTYQVLTIQAQVLDEEGTSLPELTEQIAFKPQSDWIDLSEPVIDDEKIAINMGCTSPNPNNKTANMPGSVFLSLYMDDVPEGEPPLQNDLEIALLDCRIETEIEDATFPVSDEMSEITFDAWIENAGEEKGWNFSAEYRIGVDPADPLTMIDIEKQNETRVSVRLTGPLVSPGENESVISRTLAISAAQGDEEPIERHLTIMVSQEGLLIRHGVNKSGDLPFTANKPHESFIDFALNVYDPQSNQIVVDSEGLKDLQFELLSDDDKTLNLMSVLLPQFEFIDLLGNIPYGHYKFTTQAEIPGIGDVHSIKYKVSAPVVNPEKQELFEKIINVKVKTYGIGEEFPDWVKAYEECKYVLNNYMPAGDSKNKLYDILESQKMKLGAEGMVEMRNRIWKIAGELILAEGAEGYKLEEAWANLITTTLEWTEWAGDIAFNALTAYFTGGLGSTALGLTKSTMIDAIKMMYYEPNATAEDFWNLQKEKIMSVLMSQTKGRLLSIENIELIVGKNKPLAYAVYIATEFAYNLYQTNYSVWEAAKLTAQGLTEEMIMRKLTEKLHREYMNRQTGFASPKEFFEDFMKNTKTEMGKKVLSQKKLLEIMRDPEKVRTIKKWGSPELKEIFVRTRKSIYNVHDIKLKQAIAQKLGIPQHEVIIDEFRTPGADPNSVNTDRDYRVLRKVKTAEGKIEFHEVETQKWKEDSYDIFGELTGKPEGISNQEWAEKHQQRGTDRFDAEACSDYSDHVVNPKTGEVEILDANIKQVKEGNSRLISAEKTGEMYKNKVQNSIDNGTKPEAYAQLQKGIKTLEDVRKGYKSQNLDIPELDPKTQLAMNYAKQVSTQITSDADPHRVEKIEKTIKRVTGHDLKTLNEAIENGFKDLKTFDKGVPSNS